jgi:hypothetical protein
MKRAMRAIPLTQVDDYFGEFHTLSSLIEKLIMIRKLHKLKLKK